MLSLSAFCISDILGYVTINILKSDIKRLTEGYVISFKIHHLMLRISIRLIKLFIGLLFV